MKNGDYLKEQIRDMIKCRPRNLLSLSMSLKVDSPFDEKVSFVEKVLGEMTKGELSKTEDGFYYYPSVNNTN